MKPINSNRYPRDIVWGRGSLSYLSALNAKKALIIADPAMTRLGVSATAAGYLRQAEIDTKIFGEVEPEPGIDTVLQMLELNADYCPDVIVGLGGGSAIDAGKAFRIFYEHPQLAFEKIRYLNEPARESIPPFTKTRYIAIPSTSGTGSEVSRACILTDHSISMKCPILSTELIPEMAIVDPDIADTMPPDLQADSGLDALTHAVESYVNIRANDLTRGHSLQAITLIVKHLPPAFSSQDPVAKEHMHYAATIAGLAFSNIGNGLCHTIADKIGAAFNLSHGRANGIALPYVVKYNCRSVSDRYLVAARAVGHLQKDDRKTLSNFINELCKIKRYLNVPASFKEAGISKEAYYHRLDEFVQKAYTFPATLSNPRRATRKELASLFLACYEGDYSLLE